MKAPFDGQTVLVTGGAVRVGREIALAFARQGASVIVHYRRSAEAAERLLDELNAYGSGHACLETDLTDAAARQNLVSRARAVNGRLDVLVNNASVYRRSWLRDVADDAAKQDYEINFFAPFQLMRAFARECGTGNIINLLDQRVSSVDAAAGTYALAKKSLRDATEAAALEWAPDIRVNAIAPGVVLPPPGVAPEKMLPLLETIPMKTNSSAAEIAAACTFLAASPTVTGTILYIDGGLHLQQSRIAEKDPGA